MDLVWRIWYWVFGFHSFGFFGSFRSLRFYPFFLWVFWFYHFFGSSQRLTVSRFLPWSVGSHGSRSRCHALAVYWYLYWFGLVWFGLVGCFGVSDLMDVWFWESVLGIGVFGFWDLWFWASDSGYCGKEGRNLGS
ncbi:hypothetical protein QBC44DRAFT_327745 [Cladorrhinum sp. PSN332]|nr:hypothetical protein QBC44DRAFT_327745 [Cladorrhinum sp. PSN332]